MGIHFFQKSLLFVIFLLPFLIIFPESFQSPNFYFDLQTILFTIKQALLTSIFSLIWGFLIFVGLLGVKKSRALCSYLLSIPAIVPGLVLIFFVFSFAEATGLKAKGLPNLIFAQSFQAAPLVALSLLLSVSNRYQSLFDLCYVEGVSFFRFWKQALIFLKRDLIRSGVFVFLISMTAFSLPLALSSQPTWEVLIYEKIRLDANLSQAAWMSLFYMLFLAAAAFFFLKGERHETRFNFGSRSFFGSPLLLAPSFAGLFALSLFLAKSLFSSASFGFFLRFLKDYPLAFWQSVGFTFATSLSVGLLVGFFCTIFLTASKKSPVHRVLLSGVSPSVVIVGFALILIFGEGLFIDGLKISLGLSVLYFPFIYKVFIAKANESLEKSVQSAQILGASFGQTFKRIIFPQAFPEIAMGSGFAAFLASCDFSLSSLLSSANHSLALKSYSLMSFYRVEESFLFLVLSAMIGSLCFLIIWKLPYVCSQKFKSS